MNDATRTGRLRELLAGATHWLTWPPRQRVEHAVDAGLLDQLTDQLLSSRVPLADDEAAAVLTVLAGTRRAGSSGAALALTDRRTPACARTRVLESADDATLGEVVRLCDTRGIDLTALPDDTLDEIRRRWVAVQFDRADRRPLDAASRSLRDDRTAQLYLAEVRRRGRWPDDVTAAGHHAVATQPLDSVPDPPAWTDPAVLANASASAARRQVALQRLLLDPLARDAGDDEGLPGTGDGGLPADPDVHYASALPPISDTDPAGDGGLSSTLWWATAHLTADERDQVARSLGRLDLRGRREVFRTTLLAPAGLLPDEHWLAEGDRDAVRNAVDAGHVDAGGTAVFLRRDDVDLDDVAAATERCDVRTSDPHAAVQVVLLHHGAAIAAGRIGTLTVWLIAVAARPEVWAAAATVAQTCDLASALCQGPTPASSGRPVALALVGTLADDDVLALPTDTLLEVLQTGGRGAEETTARIRRLVTDATRGLDEAELDALVELAADWDGSFGELAASVAALQRPG